MGPRRRHSVGWLLYLLIACSNLMSLMLFRLIFSGELIWDKLPLYFILYTLLWLMLLNFHGYFDLRALRRESHVFTVPAKCALYALVLMLLARFFPKVTSGYMYINLIKNGVIVLFFAFFTAVWKQLLTGRRTKNLYICGDYTKAERIVSEIEARKESRLVVKGVFSDDLPRESKVPVLGDEGDCVSALSKLDPDYVIITRGRRDEDRFQRLLEFAEKRGIYLYYMDELYQIADRKLPVRDMDSGYYFFLFRFLWEKQSAAYLFVNRIINMIAGFFGLLLSLPIIIIAGVLQQIDDHGPVFFTQKRVGKNGREYTIFKMRSMRVHDPKKHPKNPKNIGDPRITAFGRFLRKTRIDELPQFLNIILGDMNFIGPRPEQPSLVNSYASVIPFYRQRHIVKPGLTGWAQINYDYGSDETDAEKKLEYDLYYVKNRTLWLDFEIILRTAWIMVRGKGR